MTGWNNPACEQDLDLRWWRWWCPPLHALSGHMHYHTQAPTTGRMVLVTQGLHLTRRTPHHDVRPLFKGVRDERRCEDRLNMWPLTQARPLKRTLFSSCFRTCVTEKGTDAFVRLWVYLLALNSFPVKFHFFSHKTHILMFLKCFYQTQLQASNSSCFQQHLLKQLNIKSPSSQC